MTRLKKLVNLNLTILTALLIIAGYFTYISFEEVSKIEEYSLSLIDVQTNNLDINDFRSLLKENNEYLEELNSIFVGSGEEDVVFFIEKLEHLSDSLTFAVNSVSQKDLQYTGLETLQISIGLLGNLDNIIDYLSKLESLPFGINIVSVSINYNDNEGVWSSLIVIDVFKLI